MVERRRAKQVLRLLGDWRELCSMLAVAAALIVAGATTDRWPWLAKLVAAVVVVAAYALVAKPDDPVRPRMIVVLGRRMIGVRMDAGRR